MSHSLSFTLTLSAIYIYDFLARREFYEFPILHEYKNKMRWMMVGGGMGNTVDVTQQAENMLGKNSKFSLTRILKVPHYVTRCEHKSYRDEEEM